MKRLLFKSLVCTILSTTVASNIYAALVPVLQLGDGYFSYDKLGAGEYAIDMKKTGPVSYGDLQSSLNMDKTIDREKLAKNLNIDVSVSGGWGVFSASASAQYWQHTENTQYTENFTYAERYYADARLDYNSLPSGTAGLDSVAKSIYGDGSTKDVAAFTERYGDNFVQGLPMGAFLLVNFQLSFESSLDKERFDGAISGGFGSIFSASSTIQKAVIASSTRGYIEISAYQLGGEPSKLPGIFSKKTSGGYYITTCSLSDLASCQGAIRGVIKYAQGSFKQQIQANGNARPKGTLAVVGQPTLASYTRVLGLNPPPPLDPQVIAARLTLATMQSSIQQDKLFVDHLLASSIAPSIIEPYKSTLETAKSSLAWNASLFDTFNAFSCWVPGEETGCTAIVTAIRPILRKYDQKTVNQFRVGYHQQGAGGGVLHWMPLGGEQYVPVENLSVMGLIKLQSNGTLYIDYESSYGTLSPYGASCYDGYIITNGYKEDNTICPIASPN